MFIPVVVPLLLTSMFVAYFTARWWVLSQEHIDDTKIFPKKLVFGLIILGHFAVMLGLLFAVLHVMKIPHKVFFDILINENHVLLSASTLFLLIVLPFVCVLLPTPIGTTTTTYDADESGGIPRDTLLEWCKMVCVLLAVSWSLVIASYTIKLN